MMARIYPSAGPSVNKAAAPVVETKAPQEKAEKPPKKPKAETGEQ